MTATVVALILTMKVSPTGMAERGTPMNVNNAGNLHRPRENPKSRELVQGHAKRAEGKPRTRRGDFVTSDRVDVRAQYKGKSFDPVQVVFPTNP